MNDAPPPSLADLCAEQLGSPCVGSTPMPGGGSQRDFHRLTLADGRNVVGVVGHDGGEVRAFLLMTRHFASLDIPVPTVLAEDVSRSIYVMEDLGDQTLAAALARWEGDAEGASHARHALETVVRWLPVIQVRGGRNLPYKALVQAGALEEGTALDGAVFQGDLHRFREHFLPRFAPKAANLEDANIASEMESLVLRLDGLPRKHFCYRDFQARNIMWVKREEDQATGPVFLDYQSGRPGALAYDLASLLYSPHTRADEALREHLVETYLDALEAESPTTPREAFLDSFAPILLIRRLQALGAYAELGVTRGKAGYLEQIPPAVAELSALMEAGRFDLGYSALEVWLQKILMEAGEKAG